MALIGSLNCNWPDHPRILVYDLGMSPGVLSRLNSAGIEVRRVPAFCAHWRSHFTWKFWCFLDAPTQKYLWLDAGVCVLRPFWESFHAIERLGYFCVTNHWPLHPTISDAQRAALGISDGWVRGISSIASGIHGIAKRGPGTELLRTAFELALAEENLRATAPLHRHDQSLLTALLHQFFPPVVYADWRTYAGQTPNEVVDQKIWVHRRRMQQADLAYFEEFVSRPGTPRIPTYTAPAPTKGVLHKLRVAIAWARGRTPASDRAGTVIYDGMRDEPRAS